MSMDLAGDPAAAAIISSNHRLSLGDLQSDTFGLRRRVPRGGSVAVATDDPAVIAAAIVALDGWAATVYLPGSGEPSSHLPAHTLVIDGDQLAGHQPNDAEETAERNDSDTLETGWVVFTSGTTGVPKPVTHTLATLSRTVVRSESAASLIWGLLYNPNRMAGLQVIVQALASGATLVVPDLQQPLSERLRHLISGGVTALSATPTLWRLILSSPTTDLGLVQITLGGEIADQTILDALGHRYPNARIVHVFASTEAGAAFSVTDRRAGFPASYLESPVRGIRLAVRDDILYVYNPQVSAAGPDGFVSTGDVVEIVGDRVFFRGRESGVVTVGGANVWPEEVEAIIRSHPGVDDVVVTAKANAMSGSILVASVVPAAGYESEGFGKAIRTWMRGQVPKTHVPAVVKIVPKIEVSGAGKAIR